MNAIATILNLSEKEYQLEVFTNYFLWCELNAVNENDLQALLANAALHKWFMRQYTQLELQFYTQINTDNLSDVSKTYIEHTRKIGDYFPPRFLLKTIRSSMKSPISKHHLN